MAFNVSGLEMMGQTGVECVLLLSCAEVQNPVLGHEGLGLSVSQ